MKPQGAPVFPSPPDRGQRRYHVSDERLREFARLTHYERLKWVEECATFVRLGQQAMRRDAMHEGARNETAVDTRQA